MRRSPNQPFRAAAISQESSDSPRGRRRARPGILTLALLIQIGAGTPSASAEVTARFDPTPAWPLCGRIADAPPANWSPGDPCPASRHGNGEHHDGPVSSSFGPRQLPSEGFRYDFHRGLDLATPTGTPVFAITDGEVRTAGAHPSYSDPVVLLRHLRPGATSCDDGGGCYSSAYLHMDSVVVAEENMVSKGDMIGYSGASGSGFEHLHFEIRDASAQDPFSSWQRDCIHPLGVLTYPDTGLTNTTLTIDAVDTSTPGEPDLTVTAQIPMGVELDLEGLEVEVLEQQ